MRASNFCHFPVYSCLEACKTKLTQHNKLLLVAPPGAGKTTIVPLSLLDQIDVAKKIILLQPRRLAAQKAAQFMAKLCSEEVGKTIGYKIRFEEKLSSQTRIIVMTEGLFCKNLITDPELKNVALVIFDEFHERNLEADFALSLLLDIQDALRPDLKLIFMSATLNHKDLKQKLENMSENPIPLIESLGQNYPVELRYAPPPPGQDIIAHMTRTIEQTLCKEEGSLLAFLPGQKEIMLVQQGLERNLPPKLRQQCLIFPLYGALPIKAQQQAIEGIKPGKRKIVLATSIAETSLTLEDISIVIDSGLTRKAIFDHNTYQNRLYTQRSSLASAQQRAGRAGRQKAGIAVRLWAVEQNKALAPFDIPKIFESDLSPMIVQSKSFGVQDVKALRLLDQPYATHLTSALAYLKHFSIVDQYENLTQEGRHIQQYPFSIPLNLMILRAKRKSYGYLAILLALIISDKILRFGLDIQEALHNLVENDQPLFKKWRQIAKKLANKHQTPIPDKVNYSSKLVSELLLSCFHKQIAIARGEIGHFLTVQGNGAVLSCEDPLSLEKFLIILDSAGAKTHQRILLAARCEEDILLNLLQGHITTKIESEFSLKTKRFLVKKQQRLGAISLKKEDLSVQNLGEEEAQQALKEALKTHGLALLPFGKKSLNLYHRLLWLHQKYPAIWPDYSEERLVNDIEYWLWPFLLDLEKLISFCDEELYQALYYRLEPSLRHQIEKYAPVFYTTRKGKKIALHYTKEESFPSLKAKVQEFYGEKQHPTIYDFYENRPIPLKLELLSPALRPIQITQNLPLFWKGSWSEVRKDMKSRYPKHNWPQNPETVE